MQKVSTVLVVVLGLGTAHADPSATCDRLAEEARAEAVVLYAPRLVAEGARAPTIIDASDPVATQGLQARAAVSFSGIDALRGRALERIASAECAQVKVADRATRILDAGLHIGEIEAIRAEIAYRESRTQEIDTMLADATARFAAQRATARDVDELRDRRAAMRLRLADLRHTEGMLAAQYTDLTIETSLGTITKTARDTALAVDRERASLRSLSAWRLDLRAGVAAGDGADWFAVVEVGYSLGGPWQRGANRRALSARERELATQYTSVAIQLDRLRRAMSASVTAAAASLRTIEEEIATLRTERERVAAIQNDAAQQLVARFTLELVELEARKASLEALVATRRPLAEGTL